MPNHRPSVAASGGAGTEAGRGKNARAAERMRSGWSRLRRKSRGDRDACAVRLCCAFRSVRPQTRTGVPFGSWKICPVAPASLRSEFCRLLVCRFDHQPLSPSLPKCQFSRPPHLRARGTGEKVLSPLCPRRCRCSASKTE